MKNYKIMGILSFFLIFLVACGSDIVALEEGSLEMKVTIGPLCPVEPCTKTEAEKAQVYEAYSLIITQKTNKAVTFTKKASVSNILQRMPVGDYEIDISPKNIFTRKGFPIEVTIEKDKVTKVDIDVDTGIR